MLPVAFVALSLAAPVPKPPKPVLIDPAKVYFTAEQKEFKNPKDQTAKDVEYVWGKLREGSSNTGASNVPLVDGEKLEDAVCSAAEVFGCIVGADAVVQRNGGKASGNVWVCAFLGNGHSSPVKYVVDRVEVDGRTVRVVYRRPPAYLFTCDVHPYHLWAELGRLIPGKYTLELVEACGKEEEVVLMRKVTVPDPKK